MYRYRRAPGHSTYYTYLPSIGIWSRERSLNRTYTGAITNVTDVMLNLRLEPAFDSRVDTDKVGCVFEGRI